MMKRDMELPPFVSICGTQDIHKRVEKRFLISWEPMTRFFILPASMLNGGLFETILTAGRCGDQRRIQTMLPLLTAYVSVKAKRFRYKNNDMEDLEAKLKEADEAWSKN